MLAFTIGVVLFALGIGVSIALHEAGHMVTAKAFGMKVRRYFIGFGPKLFSFRRGETEYGLKLIPAGGFCDIAGMTALDEVTPEEEPRAMWRFPVWKRVTVLSAGSITHFILGFIVLYLMALVIGLPNNAEKPVVDSVGCVSNWVIKGTTVTQPACSATDPTPAKDAGFQSGDLVVSINGQATPTFEVVKSITQKLHGPATFMVERDGKQIPLTVNIATARQIPASEANSNTTTPTLAPVGAIGVSMAPYLHYGPVAALGGTVDDTGQIFVGVWQGLKSLPDRVPNLLAAIAGQPRDQNGPISVVGASELGGQAAQSGLWSVFWGLFASLQFFVGVFNLLPLLPLDGGHIAVVLYERARDWFRRLAGRPAGGPVDYTKLAPLTLIVVFLGGALMILTVTADIVNPIKLPGQ
ncbi:MAG TPA: site-2 protease family protein [Pseudonocardiaceae bacterium]